MTNVTFLAALPGAAEEGNELGNLPALVCFIAGRNGIVDAMCDVILEDFFLDATQGGPNCRYLRYNVYAVAVFIDHTRKAADLTFDAIQSLKAARLRGLFHD